MTTSAISALFLLGLLWVSQAVAQDAPPQPLTDSRPLRARALGFTQGLMAASNLKALDDRAFWSYDFETGQDFVVTATLRYTDTHAFIYVDDAETVDDTVVTEVASTFDAVYETVIGVFGDPPDVDGESRITILMLDIRDGYYHNPENSTFVPAYFDPLHEYPGAPHSNGREMLFLDVNPLDPGSADGVRALAHELEHLIHWGKDDQEAIWLDEGLAELAAWLCGYDHSPGVADYLADTGKGLMTWAGTRADHGASYLWALYLYENYGQAAIRNLVAGPERGMDGVTAIMGEDAKDIFTRWSLANYFDSGVYSYDNLTIGPGGFARPSHQAHPVPAVGERIVAAGEPEYWGANYHRVTPGERFNLYIWDENDETFLHTSVVITATGMIPFTGWTDSWSREPYVADEEILLVVSPARGSGSRAYRYELTSENAVPTATPVPPTRTPTPAVDGVTPISTMTPTPTFTGTVRGTPTPTPTATYTPTPTPTCTSTPTGTPLPSGRIILAHWGHVRITVLYSDTSCNRDSPLYLTSPDWRLLFGNAPTSVGRWVDIGYHGPGTELVFYYRPGLFCVASYSNDTSRWRITRRNVDMWDVYVEDHRDFDYNDIVFRVQQYTYVTPTPSTPTLTPTPTPTSTPPWCGDLDVTFGQAQTGGQVSFAATLTNRSYDTWLQDRIVLAVFQSNGLRQWDTGYRFFLPHDVLLGETVVLTGTLPVPAPAQRVHYSFRLWDNDGAWGCTLGDYVISAVDPTRTPTPTATSPSPPAAGPPPPPAATATPTPQPTGTATSTRQPTATPTLQPTSTPMRTLQPTKLPPPPTSVPPTNTPIPPTATPTPQVVAMAPAPPDWVLEGVVFHDRSEDGQQDGDEPGIPNVKVTLRSADDGWIKTVTTDAQGHYTFRLPGEGAYQIYVQGVPYPFQYFTTPSAWSVMAPRDLERLGTGLALHFGLSRRILWLVQLVLLGLLLALLAGSVTAVRIRQAVLERHRVALAIAAQIHKWEGR